MKKTEKGILGLSAALVVLGGGLAVLKLTEKDDNSNTDSSLSDTETTTEAPEGSGLTLIYDTSLEGPDATEHVHGVIESVQVTNETGTYTSKLVSAATDDAAAVYTLEGYEDIPLNATTVGSLANYAASLSTTALISSGGETAKFGLDDPSATVVVSYESGTTRTLYIGDEAPADSQTYVMVDGVDKVYTVNTSSLRNYSNSINDFIDHTIAPSYETGDYPIVNEVKIERKDKDDIVIKYDQESAEGETLSGTAATHVLVEPIYAYLSVERSTPITHGIFGLTAEDIYAVRASEDDIAQAGLDDPYCRLTVDTDGDDYVLLLSETFTDDEDEKLTYAMLEGGTLIYTVKAEDAPWLTLEPVDIASRNNVFTTYVWQLDQLSITLADGTKADFSITEKNSTVDRTSASSTDFDTTLNGVQFDTERYRTFYSFLVNNISAEDISSGDEISGTPLATIEMNDAYTNTHTKIDFYERSLMSVLIVIDGEARFTGNRAVLDTLAENIALLNTDEEFINTVK